MSGWGELLRRIVALPAPASEHASGVDGLHAVVLLLTLAGTAAIGAFTLGCIYLFSYEHSAEARRERRAHPLLEVGIIVGVTVLFLGLWTVGFRQYVVMQTPPPEAYDVWVTAKQWTWKFVYPDGSVSNDVLVLPRDRPVRLLLTSRDVIHSFFVPAFRTKKDAVPGRVTELWFTPTLAGRWPVYCAELCGRGHSHMRAEVVVLEPEAFARWQSSRDAREVGAPAPRDLASQGREIAARKGCLACHTVDGRPHVGPTWVGVYARDVPLANGRVVRADPAYLTASMMDPAADVVAGFEPVMPSYRGQLEAWEVAALVSYLRALRDGPDVPPGATP